MKIYARCITAYNAVIEIAAHKTTPCNKGLNPTDANILRDKPAPIRNKVNVNPVFAMATIYGLINFITGR